MFALNSHPNLIQMPPTIKNKPANKIESKQCKEKRISLRLPGLSLLSALQHLQSFVPTKNGLCFTFYSTLTTFGFSGYTQEVINLIHIFLVNSH